MKTAKNIIKELIIFLLLVLAIILILGVLLYEYVPTNKIIPEKVSYTTPENIKSELQTDESVDNTEVVVTYQIDSTDLSNYKKINEYVPGKKNPFASIKQDNTTTDGNTTSDTTANTNTTSNGNTNSGKNTSKNNDVNQQSGSSIKNNTSNGYLPDKVTK